MTDNPETIIARAICREQCAFYGEPPCFDLGSEYIQEEWQPETCCEPGCSALAHAVLAALDCAGLAVVQKDDGK